MAICRQIIIVLVGTLLVACGGGLGDSNDNAAPGAVQVVPPDYEQSEPNPSDFTPEQSDSLVSPETGEIQKKENNSPKENNDPKTAEATVYGSIMGAFKKKSALYESFSKELKTEIAKHFVVDPDADSKGTSGYGYFITMFGYTAPTVANAGAEKSKKKVYASAPGKGNGQYPAMFMMQMKSGENTPLEPCTDNICIDSPADKEEFVVDSVRIEGRINLNTVSVFGPEDPVLLISIFDETTGHALTGEIPLYSGDFAKTFNPDGTPNPNIASFSKPIAFPSPGTFSVVVSGFFNSGESVELVSEMIVITRQGIPKITLISASVDKNLLEPAPAATPTPTPVPVESGASVSATNLNLKIELISDGLKVPLYISNKDGKDEGATTWYSETMTEARQEEGECVEASEAGRKFYCISDLKSIPLHQGLNYIQVYASNPILEEHKDEIDTADYSFEFEVTNFNGGPKIQIQSPTSGTIIPQKESSNEQVEVKFCLTNIPSNQDLGDGTCLPSLPKDKVGYTVYLNDQKLPSIANNYEVNGSGIVTARVTPSFGINFVKIVSEDKVTKETTEETIAFGYGNVTPILKDGEIYEKKEDADVSSFAERGVGINVDVALIRDQITSVLIDILADEEIKKKFFASMKKEASGPPITCTEVTDKKNHGVFDDGGSPPMFNAGDSSVTFLEDTVKVGNIEVLDFKPSTASHALELNLRIHGIHGEADLKGLGKFANPESTFMGLKLNFLPLSIFIARADVRVGVEFKKNSKGILEVKIKKLDDKPVELIGDGPFGNVSYVNSKRNPLAAGFEYLTNDRGLVENMFIDILERVILCDVEDGLNHPTVGALGKHVKDIEKLTKYNQNPFRFLIDTEITLLDKLLQMDVAYNVLRGDIDIDDDGIHIRNVPLRINPGQSKLNQLRSKDEFKTGVIGPLTRVAPANLGQNAIFDRENYTKNNQYNIGLALSEDAINQALFAANISGLLDLDVDPNFYDRAGIIPIEEVAPTLGKFSQGFDLNKNGKVDAEDKNVFGAGGSITEDLIPVRLSLRSNKHLAPMLTLLTDQEAKAIVDAFNAINQASLNNNDNEASSPSDENKKSFALDPTKRYFKFVLPDVELSIYALQPISVDKGGYGEFCKVTDPQIQEHPGTADVTPNKPGEDTFCPFSGILYKKKEDQKPGETCKDLTFPTKNGGIISADPNLIDAPLAKFRGSLRLYGWIAGINRQASAKDVVLNPDKNPEELIKTFLRIRLIPAANESSDLFSKLNLVPIYGAPGFNPQEVINSLDNLLTTAITTPCQFFNEIRIPIPDRFPGVPTTNPATYAPGSLGDTLCSLGIDHLNLGVTEATLPSVDIDQNGLFMDLLGGVQIDSEGGSCPQAESGDGA
ncbi:MAG: hypothetical protein HYU97_09135 [Deltaproteobacteria bacterium]|nr:hypothetical protein [Deltaproteobacteria bacterium]